MLAPDPTTIPVAALRLVVLFTALTLLLQVVSLREWASVLRRLGFKSAADLYALVLLQLPVVAYYLSESAVTLKLKYRGRRLHKIAIPLILLTTYTSRSALESYLIYGEPPAEKLTLWRRRDAVLYAYTLLLIVLVLLVLSTL
jgi:glucan phosphoethanolaminetransferase (alkaline phosphatase superfamily)